LYCKYLLKAKIEQKIKTIDSDLSGGGADDLCSFVEDVTADGGGANVERGNVLLRLCGCGHGVLSMPRPRWH
jgi:hypothetical protein